MRILLLGRTGQLGWELERTLAPLGEMHALGPEELNLTDLEALARRIKEIHPQVIVNASAYTAVDRAEAQVDLAMLLNSQAPAVMAKSARELNAVLIHYSTDYVFDGEKDLAYTENDATNPINVYGQSKLGGEQAIVKAGCAHLILRTSWVYSLRGDSFVSKTLAWARQQETLRIVSDQVGSPTWARMLAEITAAVLAQSQPAPQPQDYFSIRSGIYHLGGSGSVSRLDFARAILRLDPCADEQKVRNLEAASTADFPTPARRPLRTSLECSRFEAAFGLRFPNWEESLRLAMSEQPKNPGP
jgi:dTDP-4-dehydrorhamnose reductase